MDLPKGADAWWDSNRRVATCIACHQGAGEVASHDDPTADVTPGFDPGEAGSSARREYDRRSYRERQRKEARVAQDAAWRAEIKASRPVVGRLAAALTPKPVITSESQATAAWKTGAIGEGQLGRMLEMIDGLQVLHDRRLPGTKANVDHIVVAPGGVFVIDAKRYKGRVQQRDKGSFFRPDVRLYVGSRDCSKLVAGAIHQAQVVRQVLDEEEDIGIFAALCFIDSRWSLFSRPSAIDGVWIGWPKALSKWITRCQRRLNIDPLSPVEN